MKLSSLKFPYPKNNFLSTSLYTGIAERKIIDHKLSIIIYIFKRHTNSYQPFCQIIGNRDDCITLFQNGKISKAPLNNHISTKEFEIVKGQDILISYVQSYLKKCDLNMSNWSLHNYLFSYQFTVRKKYNAKQKYLKVNRKEINSDMKLFQKTNLNNYTKKIRNLAFQDVSFLFYNKEKGIGYCNVCKRESTLENCSHNQKTICPSCKSNVLMKDIRKGRKNLKFVRWTLKVENAGDKLLTRYFVHTWDLSDYKNSNIKTKELIRTVHSNNASISYSLEYEEYTEKFEWTYYKKKYGIMGTDPSEYIRPRNIYLSTSLQQLKKYSQKTSCKYSGVEEFIGDYMKNQYMYPPYILDNYLETWCQKPYIEKFVKVGFFYLAREIMQDYAFSFKIIKEGTLPEMIGVSKEHFRWLLEKKNPYYTDIKILQKYPNISKKDYFTLIAYADYAKNYDAYMDCRRYTTFHKIDKYLNSQKSDVRYYRDYLDMAEKLNYDLKNTFHLFPKHLKQRHDERMKEMKVLQEKIIQEKIDAYNKELQSYMEKYMQDLNDKKLDIHSAKFLKSGNLFIRLPYNIDEIKQEGEFLHHCVGNYINDVVEGKTEIYFIRKISEPDKPFYTLEWKDNQVKQCHGLSNCAATPEVQDFSDTFCNLMNNVVAA